MASRALRVCVLLAPPCYPLLIQGEEKEERIRAPQVDSADELELSLSSPLIMQERLRYEAASLCLGSA
jgi:hypothetical protein